MLLFFNLNVVFHSNLGMPFCNNTAPCFEFFLLFFMDNSFYYSLRMNPLLCSCLFTNLMTGEITISPASGPHALPAGLVLNHGYGMNVSSSPTRRFKISLVLSYVLNKPGYPLPASLDHALNVSSQRIVGH